MFFIIISALHVSGGFSAHHQELINCMCGLGYCHAFLLSTAGVDGLKLFSCQRDATYTMLFIIISALHVSGGFSAHLQELIKLCVGPWVLSCFPAVYRWCGWAHTVL